jgi:hypothetical protein
MYTLSLCAALQQLSAVLLEASVADQRAERRRFRRSLYAMERQRDELWRAQERHEPTAVLQRGERLLRTMDAALAMLRTRALAVGDRPRPAPRVPPPPRCSAPPRFLPQPARSHGWDTPTRTRPR